MNHDLNRSTMTLDDEAAERVDKARDGLLTVLGMLSAGIPKEPTTDDIVGLTRLAASALRFRNVVRGEFIKSENGGQLPDGYNDKEGHFDPDTVH